MKRKREMEKGSEISSAIEELTLMVKVLKPGDDHDAAHIPTKPFLYVCNLVIQVLDKIGPTMAVLRQDIHQNIQRLETAHESDPLLNSNLVEILKKESSEGNARKVTSCSRAFLWLTRSMDFTLALLQKLAKDPEQRMEQAVEESYNTTLKLWHGWISAAAFKVVALKLVPDNKTFTNLLMGKDGNCETLKEEMQTLISLFLPLLEENHSILSFYGLERLKST
ncbi:glycolipid transfer protein 3-like isoform X1 [Juglans microcarpa x Juglans regia]|uniref:glycolipid transfer protein 3-like isoform X1 n=1 Tax=Juglans microcarpa x Juglans regia TaxID=2249226 RepID=UPI001B7E438A|nr:glycolipid transfer protein 3-like isoform X1 [Juglans microcarpa x Juglans regia]